MRLDLSTTVKVGLVGYGDIPTGLGQLAARLWRVLPLTRRMIIPHRRFQLGPTSGPNISVWRNNFTQLRTWLNGLDVVLYCERPFIDRMLPLAQSHKTETVCIVMPEWLPPGLSWVPHTSQFIAFTDQCYSHCESIGLRDRTIRIECPLDLDEFPFRERGRIDRVVYLDGTGGVHERKGRPVVEEMLRNCPGACEIKSLRNSPAVLNAGDLYADADLVLIPGRFDGLGLTTLEAMASGCLVLATDCAPYSEFIDAAYGAESEPDHGFLIHWSTKTGAKIWNHVWPAYDVSWADLKAGIDRVKRMSEAEISSASIAGNRYIQTNHGAVAWFQLWEVLGG